MPNPNSSLVAFETTCMALSMALVGQRSPDIKPAQRRKLASGSARLEAVARDLYEPSFDTSAARASALLSGSRDLVALVLKDAHEAFDIDIYDWSHIVETNGPDFVRFAHGHGLSYKNAAYVLLNTADPSSDWQDFLLEDVGTAELLKEGFGPESHDLVRCLNLDLSGLLLDIQAKTFPEEYATFRAEAISSGEGEMVVLYHAAGVPHDATLAPRDRITKGLYQKLSSNHGALSLKARLPSAEAAQADIREFRILLQELRDEGL